MVKKLEWDSSFFETSVYSAEIRSAEDIKELTPIARPCLVYLFLKGEKCLENEVVQMGSILYDMRVVYHKVLTVKNRCPIKVSVKTYEDGLNSDLEMLALQAGHFSRFNKDPQINGYFKALFRVWMVNSISKIIADVSFMHEEGNRIIGFISCAIKNGAGWLGLISVAPEVQGNGIGSSLLGAIERFYMESNVVDSFIVTQQDNLGACKFYESQGYKKFNEVPIYHLWLD